MSLSTPKRCQKISRLLCSKRKACSIRLTDSGGKFTLRLVHPITPVLYESLVLALIGDQFEDADGVVGCVLSVRQTEDILSVWVEEEGEGVRSGQLK